jgi:tetratricopeptide (TPR) repeat protein
MRIYVSSTSQDLKDYRTAVIAAIWRLGHTPTAMEGYVAQDMTPVEKCLTDVAGSDLYIGIFAFRYGHIPEGFTQSITELEYQEAKDNGIPMLIFLLDENVAWPEDYIDGGEAGARINALRDELKKTRLVSFFRTADDLGALVTAAIALTLPRSRIAGIRPADIGNIFRDREDTLLKLGQLLGERTVKLICIIGRGGIGKTWLLSKICLDIESGDMKLPDTKTAIGADGIIYLSCDSSDRTIVERIFHGVSDLMDSRRAEKLRNLWVDTSRPLSDKVRALLGVLREGCYLLVLDNFENLLSPDNTIADPNLKMFMELCLSTPHALRLLATSRARFVIERGMHAAQTVLLEGLPEKDSAVLLRDLDPNGELGLRNAPEALILEAVRRCHGIPRALEVIAAILSADRTLKLEELLATSSLFNERVVENLIAENYRRLKDEEKRLMEGLAVFNAPVTIDALEFLLIPMFPSLDVRANMNRLVQTCSVRRWIKAEWVASSETEMKESLDLPDVIPLQDRYVLHPLDQHFIYSQIPDRQSIFRGRPWRAAYVKPVLHAHAAEYYRKHALPRDNWKKREDIDELISAFRHYVQAGMYDDAYRLLETFDFDCLWLWGYCEEVADMHETVKGKLKNSEFQHLNQGNLGFVYWSVGRLEEALELYQQALQSAHSKRHPKSVATWLGNKGLVNYTLGNFQEALDSYEKAIRIDREINDAKGEGIHLCDMAVAYRGLGNINNALACSESGIELSRNAGDLRVESNHLSSLGACRLLMEDLSGAEHYFHQGLGIAKSINSAAGKYYNLRGLAECEFLEKDHEKGLLISLEAYEVEFPLGRYYAAFLVGLGYVASGKKEESMSAFQEAIERCEVLISLSKRNYDALFIRSISLLAMGKAADAQSGYEQALAVCSARGVVMEALQDIRKLRIASPDIVDFVQIEEFLGHNGGLQQNS